VDVLTGTRVFYLPPGTQADTPAPRGQSPPGATPLRGRVLAIAGEQNLVARELADDPDDRLVRAMNELMLAGMYSSYHLLGTSLDIQDSPVNVVPYMLDPREGWTTAAGRARFADDEIDPARWRLLAEIGETRDLILGDGGVLYFLIPEKDLAARRFDRVIGILDSH
jgi:hypothetical protein